MSQPAPVTYTIHIAPQPTTQGGGVVVPINRTQQFVATLLGSDGSSAPADVAWSTTAGTIDANGLLTPDEKLGDYTVTATQR